MVKLYTCTDREYRYKNRCNGKTVNELKTDITKHKFWVNKFSQQALNISQKYDWLTHKYNSIKTSYDFIYNNYKSLYVKYEDTKYDLDELKEKYDSLKTDHDELVNKTVANDSDSESCVDNNTESCVDNNTESRVDNKPESCGCPYMV